MRAVQQQSTAAPAASVYSSFHIVRLAIPRKSVLLMAAHNALLGSDDGRFGVNCRQPGSVRFRPRSDDLLKTHAVRFAMDQKVRGSNPFGCAIQGNAPDQQRRTGRGFSVSVMIST